MKGLLHGLWLIMFKIFPPLPPQGGREHGVPILVSVIHPDTPAARCGSLYVGDAILTVNEISLKEVSVCVFSLSISQSLFLL